MNCGGVHPEECTRKCWNCGSKDHNMKSCDKTITRVPPPEAIELLGLEPFGLYKWNGESWDLTGINHYYKRYTERPEASAAKPSKRKRSPSPVGERRQTEFVRSPSPLEVVTTGKPIVRLPPPDGGHNDSKEDRAPQKKPKGLGLSIRGRAAPRPAPSADPAVRRWQTSAASIMGRDRAESEAFQREAEARRAEEKRTGVRNGSSYTFNETFKQVETAGADRQVVSGGLSIRGRAKLQANGELSPRRSLDWSD